MLSPWLAHSLFVISAIAAVVCAILVVSRKNPIYSALFLILFFGTMAVDFLLMDAQFIAFMQILVYGGAIMVLYLFVIMLINPREEDLPQEGSLGDKGIAFGVSLLLFVLLTTAISRSDRVQEMGSIPAMAPIPATTVTHADGSTEALPHGGIALFGRELFTRHLLVFELASILITVGIVGAVFLSIRARRRQRHVGQGSAETAGPSAGSRRGEEPAHV